MSVETANGRAEQKDAGLRRIVWSSVLGSTVEWYDFLVYGTASALVFNKLFFPNLSPAIGTIAAFGSYGVGFVARPLGGVVFGHFGDRVGRKAMLAVTILMMGLGTFLIGCLPTFHQVGFAAPVLLVALRFVQGFGIGGEWGGAVLMVIESVPRERRGYYASLVQLGYPLGVILSAGVFALAARLPETELMAWGWRAPFLLSAVLVGIGLYIRLRLTETPVFRALVKEQALARVPVWEILTVHTRMFFVGIGLKVSEIAWISITTIFSISYITAHLHMSRGAVLNGILIACAIELFTLPVFGWLSDRYGRRRLYMVGLVFSMLFAFPVFWLWQMRSAWVIAATITLAVSFGQGIMFGPEAAWVAELFPGRLRYSGASMGFQIGAALGGGLTPMIAAALLLWTGGTWSISVYLIGLAAVSMVAAMAAPETARVGLR